MPKKLYIFIYVEVSCRPLMTLVFMKIETNFLKKKKRKEKKNTHTPISIQVYNATTRTEPLGKEVTNQNVT